MDNHIVYEQAAKIREIARNSLAGYWKSMFVAVLLIYLLTTGIAELLSIIFSYDLSDIYVSAGVKMPVSSTARIGYGGSLYNFIVGGPFTLGFYTLLLSFFRSKQVDNSLVFEGFGSFGKAFILQLLITVKIVLWALLFFIPGIIAVYRYSQAFFVMADHPEYTASECIEESKRLMCGNKWKLFCVQISFIGWIILASIPSALLAGSFSFGGVGAVITSIIASLPAIVLSEYTYMADVTFYELLTERLVVVSPQAAEYAQTVDAEYTVTEEATEDKYEDKL